MGIYLSKRICVSIIPNHIIHFCPLTGLEWMIHRTEPRRQVNLSTDWKYAAQISCYYACEKYFKTEGAKMRWFWGLIIIGEKRKRCELITCMKRFLQKDGPSTQHWHSLLDHIIIWHGEIATFYIMQRWRNISLHLKSCIHCLSAFSLNHKTF